MSDKDFGIWEGEKAIDLPHQTDAGALFHRPHPYAMEGAQGLPEERAGVRGRMYGRGRLPMARALKDVETCTHIVLLYWMDRSPRNLVLQVPSHSGIQRGTFALRSPARPNPIAMSVVKLLQRRRQPSVRRRARLPRRHPAP